RFNKENYHVVFDGHRVVMNPTYSKNNCVSYYLPETVIVFFILEYFSAVLRESL
ncbi:MAG: hypothetical protein MHPSP_000781, partial [Paramarteilia canceri]